MQKFTRSLFAVGAVLGLAACGDDVSVTPPTPPLPAGIASVTVVPASITIAIAEKVFLTASVTTTQGTGTPATTVTWTSANAAIATVSASGEVTGVTVGTTTIRATSTVDAGKVGAAAVTVRSPAVRGVTVTPSALALQIGQSATAVATVDRDVGAIAGVTWTTNAPAVATVDSTGRIVAVSAGTAVITATSRADVTKAAALAVTVTAVPNNLTALTVAPTNAGLGVGGTVQIVANATTVGSPTVTYTYTSSNTAVVTVNATGLVTAVGNGTAIVTTTATTNTNSLSASTTIGVASASVSISTITSGGLGSPVEIHDVKGQIEVTMNISAGNQTLDSVEVRLGGVAGASQVFTINGAPNAPVSLSINTARYKINADSSASVSFLNGVTGVQARLFAQGATGPTASNTVTITLNNSDTFHARWTLPAKSATDANGLIWYGGPLDSTTVNVVPVMYSGNTIVSATIVLDETGSPVAPISGTVAKTDTSSPFVAKFSTVGITSASVAPGVLSSLRADGNAGPGGVAVSSGTTLFANAAALTVARLDGLAPTTPNVKENVNDRQNNWVNDAVSFVTVWSATTNPNGMVDAASVDAGVSLVTYAAKAGATLAAALASADITNPTTLLASLTNGYCLVIFSVDALGNRSPAPTTCTPVTTLEQFALIGVDRAPPVISYHASSVANGARIPAASIGTEFVVTLLDTGTVGNSGMLAGSPLKATVTKRDGDDALNSGDCVVGTWSTTTSLCNQSTTGLAAPALPLVSTAIAALAFPGYYTFNGTAFDAAGNASAIAATRTFVYDDNTIPAPVITSALFNTPLSGSTATFTANASDNLDLWTAKYTLAYAGGLAGPIEYPSVILNLFNVAPLVRSNVSAGITINGFMRQVEAVTANSPITVGAQFKPTTLLGTVTDQATILSATATTNILAGSVTTGTSYLTLAPAALPRSWAVTNAATSVSDGNSTTPANALSVTLLVDLFGPTATFNSPFVRVDFYAVRAGNLVQIGSATSPTTTDDGSIYGRKHRYSLSWAPGTAFGVGIQAIYAIGVNVNGDALVTLVNSNITITNP